jgi:hypothetical protein
MKDKMRERTIRLLLSSLLRSDFTVNQLEEVADAFIAREEIVSELGRAAKELISFMRNRSITKGQYTYDSDLDTNIAIINEAMDILKRKRLSKDFILHKIMNTDPNLYNYFLERKDQITLKEMLSEFLASKGLADFNTLIESMIPTWYRDKYLQGIMENR